MSSRPNQTRRGRDISSNPLHCEGDPGLPGLYVIYHLGFAESGIFLPHYCEIVVLFSITLCKITMYVITVFYPALYVRYITF